MPSVNSQRINVPGFMNRDNDLFYYPVRGSVTGDEVIRVFEDFADQIQDPKYSTGDRYTLVVVDNASIHTCKKFREKLDDWMIEKRLIVCYLPTYSPELNLIEILWDKVKYEWLNIMKIMDFDELQKELKQKNACRNRHVQTAHCSHHRNMHQSIAVLVGQGECRFMCVFVSSLKGAS